MNTLLRTTLSVFFVLFFLTGCDDTTNGAPLVPEVLSIEIDTPSKTVIRSLDDTIQLTATVRYSDNTNTTVTYELDWDSNDSSILVHNGLVTANENNGTATITATYRGDKLTTINEVNITIDPLLSVSISSNDLNIENNMTEINSTGTYQLIAYGNFSTDNNVTLSSSNDMNWSSSNTTVITVGSTDGLLSVLAQDSNFSDIIDINLSIFNEINTTLSIDTNLTI